MRSWLQRSLLVGALVGGVWAGWRVPTVGTDDRATAHIRRMHPEFQPRPLRTTTPDERTIELGLAAQALVGASICLLAGAQLQRIAARRSAASAEPIGVAERPRTG